MAMFPLQLIKHWNEQLPSPNCDGLDLRATQKLMTIVPNDEYHNGVSETLNHLDDSTAKH